MGPHECPGPIRGTFEAQSERLLQDNIALTEMARAAEAEVSALDALAKANAERARLGDAMLAAAEAERDGEAFKAEALNEALQEMESRALAAERALDEARGALKRIKAVLDDGRLSSHRMLNQIDNIAYAALSVALNERGTK